MIMKKALSKLHKVDLRDVWGHGVIDLTAVLIQKVSGKYLGELKK
jgi:hypothetical protein